MGFPQRAVNPTVQVPHSERVQLIAGADVADGNIVIVNGRVSGHMRAVPADADAVLTARGRLWIAVGPAASGQLFDAVPWRAFFNVDTSTWSAAGDPVFLSGTAGAVSATPGAVGVQVGEVLEVSATTGAYILDPNVTYGTGGGGSSVSASFPGLALIVNDDAVAATNEDPRAVLLGGDGGSEVLRTQLLMDSSADRAYLHTSLASLGATVGDRTTNLTIGPMGNANNTANDIDAVLTLRAHVNGAAVGSWLEASLALDAGLGHLIVTPPAGGELQLQDNSTWSLGSSSDDKLVHNGTDSIWTHATGDLVIDNTAVTKATILRLGTNTAATSLQVRNDADTALLTVAGSGTITIADGCQLHMPGAGTGSGDDLIRFGASLTEGMVLRTIEVTVNPAAIETAIATVPLGSAILAVQANVQTGLTGGGTTVTWSIGTSATPNKYGTAGFGTAGGAANSLAQNGKSNWMPSAGLVFLTAAEPLVLTGAAAGGAADGDTALTVGSVRVRVIYLAMNSLDNV